MTTGVVILVSAYVVLAVLLLSLNLRARWPWRVKALAIVLTAGFFVAAFAGQQALLGWATEAAPPADFRLHAGLVIEPDRNGSNPGAIYLWLSPIDEDGAATTIEPRAHALPYSRQLHEQVAKLLESMQEGRDVRGRVQQTKLDWLQRPTDIDNIRLFEVQPKAPPPKLG